jgi:hypothetical protein
MTVTLETTDTAGNNAASRPPRPEPTAHHTRNAFAIPAEFIVAVALTLLIIIIAVTTLANDGLHANWR